VGGNRNGLVAIHVDQCNLPELLPLLDNRVIEDTGSFADACTGTDRDVVANLGVVTDDGTFHDTDIGAERAVVTDFGVLLDVTVVTEAGEIPDLGMMSECRYPQGCNALAKRGVVPDDAVQAEACAAPDGCAVIETRALADSDVVAEENVVADERVILELAAVADSNPGPQGDIVTHPESISNFGVGWKSDVLC